MDGEAARATGPPTVTGLSPTEGIPGTQITIRGENLGVDQNDLLMLFVCGTDCLHTARWKSPSKIIARLGQANRGLGEVKIATKSGGRGVSNVKFRVFIAQVGPLEETAVWVDESRTVPGREAVRVMAPETDERDALGLRPTKRLDQSILQREFPEGSGNLRMESFSPQWYLLENHSETTIEQLREAIKNMELAKADETRKNEQIHKANLYSLINCVDTLAALHEEIERSNEAGDFAVIKQMGNQISDARTKAESVFKDVLSRKDRADATRNALSVLTRFKFIFFLSRSIEDNMAKGEYLTILNDYTRAKCLYGDTDLRRKETSLGEYLTILNDYTRAKSLYGDTDVPLFKEVMADLEIKMNRFKEELKCRLLDTPASYEEQSKLIKYLKILEPDSDPTWECITAYHCWLEEVLWKLQQDHFEKACDAASNGMDTRYSFMETNERQSFVSSLVTLLLNKLQSFWKLSNTYNTNDDRWVQRQDDINQMLTNTINVSSWLLLNALVPRALPDDVIRKYESQFVKWPEISADTSRQLLRHALKTIRSFISSLLDAQFTVSHVQPLVELCMTLRLKVVSDAVDKAVENTMSLSRKETWRQETTSGRGAPKTALPDLYENEVCECITSIRDALASTGFSGEMCLFSREAFRRSLIDLFVHLIYAVKHCFERLLGVGERRRPQDLDLSRTREEDKSQLTTRKLLMVICNLEYVIEVTLRNISRRMTEAGVKYADMIYEKAKSKLVVVRGDMVAGYNQTKADAYSALVKTAEYSYPPDEDVSDYAKELMMCCVLQQAELELCAPQLTKESLESSIRSMFTCLLDHLAPQMERNSVAATQCVIDICALEQALGSYAGLEIRTMLNSFRAGLVSRLDHAKLQRCLVNMRSAMRLAMVSLERLEDEEDLDSSNI